MVTAVAEGAATITASSGSASTTAPTTVSQVAAAVALFPTSLSFVSIGATATLTPTVTDAGGTVNSGDTVTWATCSLSLDADESDTLV